MQQQDDEWQSALRDASVPKGRDEYGNITVAKLRNHVHTTGRGVSSVRELKEERAQEVAAGEEIVNLGQGGAVCRFQRFKVQDFWH